MNLSTAGEPLQIAVGRVTHDFFEPFNAPLLAGRVFASRQPCDRRCRHDDGDCGSSAGSPHHLPASAWRGDRSARGTRYDAFVDGDHSLKSVLPTITTPAMSATPAANQGTDRLTNQDITDMVGAGIGTDVILADIANSATAFDTSPNGLIALRKAGVADTVITAIVRAGSGAGSRPNTTPAITAAPPVKDLGEEMIGIPRDILEQTIAHLARLEVLERREQIRIVRRLHLGWPIAR